MTAVTINGKSYMLTREPTDRDWQEIYALNKAYKQSGDYRAFIQNLSHLCYIKNPLAFVKFEIIGEQKRQADDMRTDGNIKPKGDVYRE